MSESSPTACVVLIGNEILSGKTQDANLSFIGAALARLGIRLIEARVIRDDKDTIASVVNECRAAHTYVFTTGGIGPTHDDITAESVARAFGVELVLNDSAVAALQASGRELNEARLKMAMVPAGASLIENSVSAAPGFRMDNVFVLAGIPRIAQAMFEALEPALEHAAQIVSANVDVYAPEGDLAQPLAEIADAHPAVEIGSYPFSRDGIFGANLVVRGTDRAEVDRVRDEIVATMSARGLKLGA